MLARFQFIASFSSKTIVKYDVFGALKPQSIVFYDVFATPMSAIFLKNVKNLFSSLADINLGNQSSLAEEDSLIMLDSSFLILFSIGTGAMLYPPAVTISSFIRPLSIVNIIMYVCYK